MTESLQTWIFKLEQWSNAIVVGQLDHLTIWTILLVWVAGLATSLSPCTLSMLPLTIGYIGGYESQTTWQAASRSAWFALGFATTLTGFGMAAAWFGKIYGQIGGGWSIALGAIAIVMGLQLLELFPMQLPNWGNIDIPERLRGGARAYAIGLTFGLVASPCSTPVLVTLLTWTASTQNPLLGSIFLLTYALGAVLPLALAGTFTGSIKQIVKIRAWSGWITRASGAILLAFGTYTVLNGRF